MCVFPQSPCTNVKAPKIRIYNDAAEMAVAVNGLVIISLPSLG